VLVFVAGIAGKTTGSSDSSKNHLSSNPLSPARVDSYIRQSQLPKVVHNIRVIHITKTAEVSFVYASFESSGHPEYVGLEVFHNGFNSITFSIDRDKHTPIRYVSLSGDGFEYDTGVVMDHSNVKTAVMIFSDGSAVSVPVKNGYFWYVRRIEARNKGLSLRRVIGITDQGTVVRNLHG
jgi:hypothetical protein